MSFTKMLPRSQPSCGSNGEAADDLNLLVTAAFRLVCTLGN
jgi:hypothetical protein